MQNWSAVKIIDILPVHICKRNIKLTKFRCVNNGIRVIENEYYLITVCPLYQHLRSKFQQDILCDYSFNAFCSVM